LINNIYYCNNSLLFFFGAKVFAFGGSCQDTLASKHSQR
jgi:hypothetical protein